MGVLESVALALSALSGGLVGAAAAAYLAGTHVAGSIEGFRNAFRAYIEGKNDAPTQVLKAAFDELDRAWITFGSALERLGKAARLKK